jgi:hypothetical protein
VLHGLKIIKEHANVISVTFSYNKKYHLKLSTPKLFLFTTQHVQLPQSPDNIEVNQLL